MRISRMVFGAAVAAMLAAAMPEPAGAQIPKLIKKKIKEKAATTVIKTVTGGDTAQLPAAATPVGAEGAPAAAGRSGPAFSENLLEMTPELLDRLEKGLAAEEAVRQEVERLVGKVLAREEYDRCTQAVIASPEGQKVYMGAADLLNNAASQEQMQKASEELARRFDRLTEPKCGLEPRKAEEIRRQHADRVAAAAPEAAGLTKLQLYLLKERLLPFCAAAEVLPAAGSELRVATESQAIFWVYTPLEVEALRPRCGRLMTTLRSGA